MSTWHLHIQGQVQGVGFRPFIYLLAQRYELSGWVNNGKDGVHIEFNADTEKAHLVKKIIEQEAPRLAIITVIKLYRTEEKYFDDFKIIHSKQSGSTSLLLTPDFALCADCQSELNSDSNRRKAYPFITCTNCGPRFSIITRLPYDRKNTTMDSFVMCKSCSEEYNDPRDRRYFSQTNSCPECRIEMSMYNSNADLIETDEMQILNRVVEAWEAGQIVAIKGIGGYLLTCAAQDKKAVQVLRKRKHRPSKPFALMYPGISSLGAFNLSTEMMDLLQSPVSPIVLLDREYSLSSDDEVIAPGLNQWGVMLPYTPLYQLLLQKFGQPIVATSGNRSNAIIIYDNETALRDLSQIADFIVVNNRDITLPQDDSVFRYSYFKQKRILLRRSRGLAPTYLNPELSWDKETILASGAMLKSTFSLVHNDNVYISPYLGDLEHYESQKAFSRSVDHFIQLTDAKLNTMICDLHPDYSSTRLAEDMASEQNLSLHHVQHHQAHFGAILGEHNLIHSKEPVLGVIWDGTGLGDDRQIWGGEFFTYDNYHFERYTHFGYFPAILGDKMPREPRISALSVCAKIKEAASILDPKFTKTERQIYAKLLSKSQTVQTSSVGRLFDAVAALLGVMDYQTYEGEAAMRLESLATQYCKSNGLDVEGFYPTDIEPGGSISLSALLIGIIEDIEKGYSKAAIAAKFHFSLVLTIQKVAEKLNIKRIGFSGGVFQNALLIDMIIHHLDKKYDLYFHEQLSPNDENISFGQLMCYRIKKINKEHHKSKSINHVFSHSR